MEIFLVVVAGALVVGVLLFLVLSRYEGPVVDLTEEDPFPGASAREAAIMRDDRSHETS